MTDTQENIVRAALYELLLPAAAAAATETGYRATERELEQFCRGTVSGVLYMLDPVRESAIRGFIAMTITDGTKAN